KPPTNQDHREGVLAKTIEKQTAKLPSDSFLWLALGSIATSLALKISGRQKTRFSSGNGLQRSWCSVSTINLSNNRVQIAWKRVMIPTKPGENHLRPVVDPNYLHLIASVITPDPPFGRSDYTP